jgi:diaminohydroxyphosphoribosylaminopyrimidine deaminase / 5-amino-6-(5-phosphoribosylamino)uracil reductase
MSGHEEYMLRCIALARRGAGRTDPNPMVGSVIVHEGKIIGEGWHQQYGGPHAEVNAIRSVADPDLLSQSTIYVNLEPCSHFGKTPPCADLIIEKKIPYVVIGCLDQNPIVSGNGVLKLTQAGIDVKVGIAEKESRFLNRRFLTWHEKKRPYVILKWAQSADGFIDHDRNIHGGKRAIISSPESHLLVHQWRAEESAILVGTNTVLEDDPQLTVRLCEGKNPVRVSFDRRMRIPSSARILDGTAPTIIFHSGANYHTEFADYIPIDFELDPIEQALAILHERKFLSVLVEGGAAILKRFFEVGYWDEAKVFVSENKIENGIKAPVMPISETTIEPIGPDQLYTYYNPLP